MKLPGIIHRWIDAETFEAVVSVKVSGIRTPKRDGEEREHGDLALAFAESVAPPGTRCDIDVARGKVKLVLLDGSDYAGRLLQCGHAGPASEEPE